MLQGKVKKVKIEEGTSIVPQHYSPCRTEQIEQSYRRRIIRSLEGWGYHWDFGPAEDSGVAGLGLFQEESGNGQMMI